MQTRVCWTTALLLAACSAAEGPDAVRAPIIDGTPETGRMWAVAVLNWDRGSGGGLCSGTLVAPDAVLTAKHCASHRVGSDFGSDYVATAADRIEVRLGAHAIDDVREVRGVREVRATPGPYSPDRILEGEDLAVLLLDAPLEGVEPRTFAPEMPLVGSPASIVGYGAVDADAPTFGAKHTGQTEIVEIGSWLVRTHGDTWTCQGDSGGPLLVDGVVVGVTSAGRGGCRRDAEHLYTATAPHRALIESALPAAPPAAVDAGVSAPMVDEPPAVSPPMDPPRSRAGCAVAYPGL